MGELVTTYKFRLGSYHVLWQPGTGEPNPDEIRSAQDYTLVIPEIGSILPFTIEGKQYEGEVKEAFIDGEILVKLVEKPNPLGHVWQLDKDGEPDGLACDEQDFSGYTCLKCGNSYPSWEPIPTGPCEEGELEDEQDELSLSLPPV